MKNLDLRILPIFGMILILLIDLGCVLNDMNPTEVYGSLWQLLVLHGIIGLGTGLSIGSFMNDN